MPMLRRRALLPGSGGLIALLCILALHGRTSANVVEPNRAPVSQAERYPSYSSRFTGQPSPFHETVAALILKGARRAPDAVAQNLWSEGLGASNVGSYHLPIFSGSGEQSVYTFRCVTFGRCNADGRRVHLPAGAGPSPDSDHHLISFDPTFGGEVDGWGGDGNPAHRCAIIGSEIGCSWGGFFPFSGNGLDANSGNSANNGGYAFGIFEVTAQEIIDGHIDHALGMVASCLDNPDIYPADTSKQTDTKCTPTGNSDHPQYGQLVHLKNTYDVAASDYSPQCKVYLTALQTYGAYTYDTNNGYGIALGIEDTSAYADPNPWYTQIFPAMARHGDGVGSGPGFRYESCLNRLTADDVEVYDIAPGT